MIDLGLNVQAAGDAARFRHDQEPNRTNMEAKLYDLVGPQLISMGHSLRRADGSLMGGYQAIHFTPDPTAQVSGRRSGGGGRLPGGHRLPQGRSRDRLVTAARDA